MYNVTCIWQQPEQKEEIHLDIPIFFFLNRYLYNVIVYMGYILW